MSAFVRANPLGWSVGSPVTSAQMNALDLDHVKTINIVDGLATYNPVGLIQIGGAGFRWNGPSLFHSTSTTTWAGSSTIAMQGVMTVSSTGKIVVTGTGDITVQSSGEVAVESGGEINLNSGSAMTWADGSLIQAEDGSTFQLADGSVINFGGIVNFGATSEIFGAPRLASSATLTAQSGAAVTMASGSTLTAASGSTVTFSGTTTFANSTWPALSPARTWSRRNLRMVGTDEPTKAEEMFGVPTLGASKVPYIQLTGQSPAFLTLLEIDDLPDGQTITSVVVRSVGVSGAPIITDEATYRVVRWTDETGPTAMSAATNDAHTSGNWSTTVLDTTITITSNSTIDRSYRYGVEVQSQNVTGDAPMNIISVRATGTAASIRV